MKFLGSNRETWETQDAVQYARGAVAGYYDRYPLSIPDDTILASACAATALVQPLSLPLTGTTRAPVFTQPAATTNVLSLSPSESVRWPDPHQPAAYQEPAVKHAPTALPAAGPSAPEVLPLVSTVSPGSAPVESVKDEDDVTEEADMEDDVAFASCIARLRGTRRIEGGGGVLSCACALHCALHSHMRPFTYMRGLRLRAGQQDPRHTARRQPNSLQQGDENSVPSTGSSNF